MNSANDIVQEVSSALHQAHTQSLDISFNELLDMHDSGELNIAPDYQRLFRWSEGQRSRIIESLLLEMPIPPVFVIEDEENKYQLIDGLQRISSYLHLRGQLDAPHLDPPVKKGEFLRLVDCDIVTALNGLTWHDLPSSLQIRLKRSFIRVEVVRKESDPRFKYHMFKRLNTGGEKLSDQQIRNATVRMLGNEMPDFLSELSQVDAFVACVGGLTQERFLSGAHDELVLRFFALKNNREKFKHEVGDFLTEFMEGVAKEEIAFDYLAEKEVFVKTFEALKASMAEMSFSFLNKRTGKLTNGFGIYHFEAVTMGLQAVLSKLDSTDDTQMKKLQEVLTAVKTDGDFVTITTGGGKNSPGPLKARIEFVEKALADAFSS
ncbi:DUF262 domain-containing protein [Ruegeria lacuscaerulensis]|uniref:DUF262 domain-containing protein n=1 Tax=Ruegeria lacuscaerulensis TaxID=55218 RepID=UPI0014798846|nr:DUF262 domain-containing protein [Ruegeria lacuscaerulensis]